MANFQNFHRAGFHFFLAAVTAHFAHRYFVLNFSHSAQKQHILVFRNTPNCSFVHSGMKGISLTELALHNRCDVCFHLYCAYMSVTFQFIHIPEAEMGCQIVSIAHCGTLSNESLFWWAVEDSSTWFRLKKIMQIWCLKWYSKGKVCNLSWNVTWFNLRGPTQSRWRRSSWIKAGWNRGKR